MQGPFWVKYATGATVQFVLYLADGTALQASATITTGDVKIVKDGAAIGNTSNLPVNEGGGIYSLTLTASELTAERVTVILDDATATETFLGTALHFVTFGNASAAIDFDLSQATPAVDVTEIAGVSAQEDGLGRFEVDVERVDGAALAAHTAGMFPADVAEINADAINAAAFATDAAWAPYGGKIWLDTVAGAAGTTIGTHGLPSNPVDTIADAKTLADALGTKHIVLIGGSSITLAATMEDYVFEGMSGKQSASINLGSQDVDDSRFINCQITGTQGGTGLMYLDNCDLGAVTTLHCVAKDTKISGNQTFSNNDDIVFERCHSGVSGGSTPQFTLAASTDVQFRGYSGGIELLSGGASNSISVEGHGQIIVNASCTNLTVNLRGAWKETDNGTGTTLVNEASFSRTAATVDANLIQVDGVNLGTHAIGSVPADLRHTQGDLLIGGGFTGAVPVDQYAVDGVDLAAHLAGHVPTDIQAVNGLTPAVDTWANALALGEELTISASPAPTNESFAVDGVLNQIDDVYIDRVGVFRSGNLTGRPFYVTDFAAGPPIVFTVDRLHATPAAGDKVLLLP